MHERANERMDGEMMDICWTTEQRMEMGMKDSQYDFLLKASSEEDIESCDELVR